MKLISLSIIFSLTVSAFGLDFNYEVNDLTLLGELKSSKERVGDWIVLDGVFNEQNINIMSEHLSVRRGSMSTRTITKLNDVVLQNKVTRQREIEVVTRESSAFIVEFCESFFEGVSEQLELEIGPVDTCKLEGKNLANVNIPIPGSLDLSEATLWLGEFPIHGVVKIVTPQGEAVLKFFNWNE